MIIDIHTHAFPDKIALKAIPALEKEADIKAFHDGRISSLLKSMDIAGIDKAVVCSIATKPDQFQSILKWSAEISSERIITFPSIHPENSDIKEKIKIIYNEGFKGIKLHPYYQEFKIDEQRMFPIYEQIAGYGLLLVFHTGFDIAFPKYRIADPIKIINIYNKFPDLKIVTTHFGAWEDWDEAENHIIGKKIYMEISFSSGLLHHQRMKEFILKHPSDYILFGTDSPWTDQKQALEDIDSLNLDEELEKKILSKNACRLLGI